MRGSTWRRALWRVGAAILVAIVLQLASAHGARAGDLPRLRTFPG